MTKTPRTAFGLRVLRARKSANMTQAALAAAVGCTQANISEAEREAGASMLTVKIARATGVDPDWLSSGKGDMFKNVEGAPAITERPCTEDASPPSVIHMLAELLAPLNPSKRKAVGSLLQSLIDDPDQADSILPDISYLMRLPEPRQRQPFLFQ